jgi:hypothetical protein
LYHASASSPPRARFTYPTPENNHYTIREHATHFHLRLRKPELESSTKASEIHIFDGPPPHIYRIDQWRTLFSFHPGRQFQMGHMYGWAGNMDFGSLGVWTSSFSGTSIYYTEITDGSPHSSHATRVCLKSRYCGLKVNSPLNDRNGHVPSLRCLLPLPEDNLVIGPHNIIGPELPPFVRASVATGTSKL